LVALVTACGGGSDMTDGAEPHETSTSSLTSAQPISNLKVANFGVKPDAKPSKVLAPLPDGSGEPARSGQLLVKFKTPLAPTPTMQAFRGINERTLTDEAKRRLPGLDREGVRVSRARALHAPHRLHPNARGATTPTTAVGAYVVDVAGAGDSSIAELAKKVSAQPDVEWAEPNYIRQTSAVPNDTYYGQQWHLPAISAPAAWDTTKGAKHIIIAVVDSGVDYTHPDLAPNIWTNVDEVPGDGVDNDNNGFVDDVRGWDFEAGDADPQDELGHGTHVSGIAAARGNDGFGVAGVAWNARIMPVRAGNLGLADSNIVAAIHYAVDNGADVINMSFGGYGTSSAIQEAIRYAADRDVVLVAAAGNESGAHIPLPAGYPEVISVAALDESGVVAGYSNFGSFVDVAAPGSNILSTLSGGWGFASGTSMATPVVAGLAALAKSAHPEFTANAIRYQILSTATDLSVPNPTRVKQLGSGKANAQLAVAARSSAPWVSLLEHSLTEVGGDLDGEFEATEAVRLTATLAGFADTTTAQVSVSSTDPWLTLSAPAVNVSVPYGGTTSASFQFTVKSGVPADRVATITLRVQSGSLVRTFPIEVQLAPSFRNPVELPANLTQSLVQLPESKAALVYDNFDWRTNGHWRIYGTIRQANGLFSQPVVLSNAATDASNSVARADASGVVHVVFRQYDANHDNPKLYYVKYQPSTSSWSSPEAVGAADHYPNWYSVVAEESLAIDSAGRPHVSWYDFNPSAGQGEVRTAMRTASGWVRTTHFAAPGFAEGDNKLVNLPDGRLGFFYTLGQNGTQYLTEWNGTSWSAPRAQDHGGLKAGTEHPFVFDGQVYRAQAEGDAMGAPYQLAVLANDHWTPITQIGSTLDNYTFKDEIGF
jgi:subtilisin family serine protease